MKKGVNLFFALMLGFSLVSCDKSGSNNEKPEIYENPSAPAEKQPEAPKENTKMEFPETEFDFGTITQGEMVTHVFKFKNTGNAPLVISDARADCGCTVPNWPKTPIMPGQENQIEVKFNSAGKEGQITKTITILANTDPSDTKIHLTGKVNVKGGAPLNK